MWPTWHSRVDNVNAPAYSSSMGGDVHHVVRDCLFVWNSEKAAGKLKKHGVSFSEACEVFFFPYYRMEDAGGYNEERWTMTGYTMRGRLLRVVTVELGDVGWRIISAREVTPRERERYEEGYDT
ncbi:MAG: BrnT family toxin [Thermodesulfobacteriota bacterium]